MISDNISENIQQYKDTIGSKEYDPIKTRKTPLTDQKRVELAYDYIFSLISEEQRNTLLKEFIYKFTRNASKITEDNHWLYNKYTNKPLLCKHYLYLIEISPKLQEIQNSVLSAYSPVWISHISEIVEGPILIVANEGFSDDTPINTYEVIRNDDLSTKIEEKLKGKEETINYIKIFGSMIGVNLEEEDIY